MHFFTQPGIGPGGSPQRWAPPNRFRKKDDPNCGLILDRKYHLGSLIGAGGMGKIYRAIDLKDGSVVVVKIRDRNNFKKVSKRRITQEVEAIRGMDHPNIVSLKDSGTFLNTDPKAGELREMAYEVMELMVGLSLHEYMDMFMRRFGMLSWRMARSIAEQACLGLGAMHEHGILHRDVKTENIFLTRDDTVKIYDFDLSRFCNLEGDGEMHTPGIAFGTTHFISPERAYGLVEDHRSDIFSLGIVLFDMVYGALPFDGKTIKEVMERITGSSPRFPDPSASWITAPRGIVRVISRALEKNPDKRYQSMSEMRDDILAIEENRIVFGHGFDDIQVRAKADPWMIDAFNTMDIIERITARLSLDHSAKDTQELSLLL